MTPELVTESSEVRTAFLADHRRLDRLLERLAAAFEADDREDIQDLWAEFETGLSAHIDAEEAVMIPALAESDRREANALLKEHRYIRDRLAELGPDVDLHVVRSHVARAFIDELRAHAAREDRLLYRWADLHLKPRDRATLFAKLANSVRRIASGVLVESRVTLE